MNEHAPLVGNRRGQGTFLCHRSSKGCTCQGDSRAKKAERRMVKKIDRQAFRQDLRNGVYA